MVEKWKGLFDSDDWRSKAIDEALEPEPESEVEEKDAPPPEEDDTILIEYLDTGQRDRVSRNTCQGLFSKGKRIRVIR
jgi:hypothetical protein